MAEKELIDSATLIRSLIVERREDVQSAGEWHGAVEISVCYCRH